MTLFYVLMPRWPLLLLPPPHWHRRRAHTIPRRASPTSFHHAVPCHQVAVVSICWAMQFITRQVPIVQPIAVHCCCDCSPSPLQFSFAMIWDTLACLGGWCYLHKSNGQIIIIIFFIWIVNSSIPSLLTRSFRPLFVNIFKRDQDAVFIATIALAPDLSFTVTQN